MGTPLVDREYLLEHSGGKSGWTFTEIPEILPDSNAPFSWVRVRGSIDGYEISNYHLYFFLEITKLFTCSRM